MINAMRAHRFAECVNAERKSPSYIWKVLSDRIEYANITKS